MLLQLCVASYLFAGLYTIAIQLKRRAYNLRSDEFTFGYKEEVFEVDADIFWSWYLEFRNRKSLRPSWVLARGIVVLLVSIWMALAAFTITSEQVDWTVGAHELPPNEKATFEVTVMQESDVARQAHSWFDYMLGTHTVMQESVKKAPKVSAVVLGNGAAYLVKSNFNYFQHVSDFFGLQVQPDLDLLHDRLNNTNLSNFFVTFNPLINGGYSCPLECNVPTNYSTIHCSDCPFKPSDLMKSRYQDFGYSNGDEYFSKHNSNSPKAQQVEPLSTLWLPSGAIWEKIHGWALGGFEKNRPTKILEINGMHGEDMIYLLNNPPPKMTIKCSNEIERSLAFYVLQLFAAYLVLLEVAKEVRNYHILFVFLWKIDESCSILGRLFAAFYGFFWYIFFPCLIAMLSFFNAVSALNETDLLKESLAMVFLLEVNNKVQYAMDGDDFQIRVTTKSKEYLQSVKTKISYRLARSYLLFIASHAAVSWYGSELNSSAKQAYPIWWWEFIGPIQLCSVLLYLIVVSMPSPQSSVLVQWIVIVAVVFNTENARQCFLSAPLHVIGTCVAFGGGSSFNEILSVHWLVNPRARRIALSLFFWHSYFVGCLLALGYMSYNES